MSKGKKLPFMEGGTIALPRLMLDSPQYQRLSCKSRCLLTAMHVHWRPNEPIAYGCREAERVLHCSRRTARRVFLELEDAGFIVMIDESSFSSRTQSRARTWRLTYMPFDGRRPTGDWAIEKQVNRCPGVRCNEHDRTRGNRASVDKSVGAAKRDPWEALLAVPDRTPEPHTYIYQPVGPSLIELIERMAHRNHLERVAA